jgi:beta-phosphoglucomutase-like phosphatase (HAD superfamily)
MSGIDTVTGLESFLRQNGELELALWDFDGVVVDSEPLHAEAYREILGRLGKTPEADFFEDLAGRTESKIWGMLIEDFALNQDAAELRRERLTLVTERLAQVPPNWFVLPLLEHLERRDVPSRIVSSGNESVIWRYLNAQGLAERFPDVSVGAPGDTGSTKPERIAEMLEGISHALLIEDSAHYLEVGRSLGAITLAVRHALNTAQKPHADAFVFGGLRP